MAIVYCDWATGDDGTGDGSAGNPYKTITQASTGLTGGDEVRVGKSPADTALTGTLGFTLDSTAVTGSSTLFTSELVIGDFVKGGDGAYYEVITITDNTNAVLFKRYPSTTGAGVSSYKLGITSTGAAAASSTAIQTISASGSSTSSRLKISGGWDLGTTTQTGETYFRQMHGTFGVRYGRGLYTAGKSYIELEKCHFLRYDNGIYAISLSYSLITDISCLSAGDEAMYLNDCDLSEFTDIRADSSADRGIHLLSCDGSTFTNTTANSCANFGFNIGNSHNNTFENITAKSNYSYGVYITTSRYNVFITVDASKNNNDGFYVSASYNNKFASITANDNGRGFYATEGAGHIITGYTGSGNTTSNITVNDAVYYFDIPVISVQHMNAAGTNICYYEFGETHRDTTDARSTQCLKYDPSSATYYISQSFFFPCDSGVAQTLSAYIKDGASFNGDIQAAIYFLGEKITGWTAWTPTTSYVQKTIVAASGDVSEDGVLELRIKVRGTAGNVFVDDLGTA